MSKLTNFDTEVVVDTLKKIKSGEEFFYIATSSSDTDKYTIGSVSEAFFNRFNSSWDDIGNHKYKMVRATKFKVEALIKHNKFLQNQGNGHMIQSRAKIYLRRL